MAFEKFVSFEQRAAQLGNRLDRIIMELDAFLATRPGAMAEAFAELEESAAEDIESSGKEI